MAGSSRIDELRKRLEKDPGSRLFAQLAEELRKAGELGEAVSVARTGLTGHPNYPSARMTLGRALMESGDLARARVEFESVLAGAADNILASRLLAECLEGLGETGEALARYELTLQLAPGDAAVEKRIAELSTAAAAPVAAPSGAAATAVAAAADELDDFGGEGLGDLFGDESEPGTPAVEPPPIPLVSVDTETFELEQPHEAPARRDASAAAPPRVPPHVPKPTAGSVPPAPARMDEFEFEDEEPTTLFGMKVPDWVREGKPLAGAPEPGQAPPSRPGAEPGAAAGGSPPDDGAELGRAAGRSAPGEAQRASVGTGSEAAPPGLPHEGVTAEELAGEGAASGPDAAPAAGGPSAPGGWDAGVGQQSPAPSAPVQAQEDEDFEYELEQPVRSEPFRPIIPDIPLTGAGGASAGPKPGLDSAVPELASPTLGELYFNQGATDKAAAVYRQLVAREPANLRFQARLSEIEALDRQLGGGAVSQQRRDRIEATILRLEALLAVVQREQGA